MPEQTSHKDAFGHAVFIGDTVAYVLPQGRSKRLHVGEVTEFSKEGHCVYVDGNRKEAYNVIKKVETL
jgi:hypothetical protein